MSRAGAMKRIAGPLTVGVVGLALGGYQFATDPRRAALAYTAAFVLGVTIALGALLFVMITHTARARWFVVLRRITGAIASTMPVFLVLFVPVALNLRSVYPWAGPSDALDPDGRTWVAHVHAWLNVPFFIARSFAYLAIWSVLAVILQRAAAASDRRPSAEAVARERTVSAVGLPLVAITLTLAAFDWVMSLNTRWASDMMGVYVFAGSLGGAIGTTAVASWVAFRAGLLPPEVGASHFHALGRVLFMTVIFWAYIAFCQFALVWMTDMARESSFYAARVAGVWVWVSVALFLVHFAVPFLLLLSRSLKRAPMRLAIVGGWLVGAHALDTYWLVVPRLHAGVHWLDTGFFLGVCGVSAAVGVTAFSLSNPFPVHDPQLAESLRYESP